MTTSRRWWLAIGVATILASLSIAAPAAAADTSGPGKPKALTTLFHTPSAAERSAAPASMRNDVGLLVARRVYIKNWTSLKCMEDYAFGTANGSKVVQWRCTGGLNQKWDIYDNGGGWWQIVNAYSGKCLDTTNHHVNGDQMIQWSCGDTNANQIFFIENQSLGCSINCVTMQPLWDTRKCVEVYGGSSQNGTKVDPWTCNGRTWQEWQISDA